MCPLDSGFGIKAIFLAHALGMPLVRFKTAKTPFIDGPLVNRYATKRDILFSQIYIFVMSLYIFHILLAAWIFDIL